MKTYLRFLTPRVEPFDPLELAEETEKIVCQEDQRKYTDFSQQLFMEELLQVMLVGTAFGVSFVGLT